MRFLVYTCALLLISAAVLATETDGPHHMTKPDGSADPEKCAVCHNSDMSLSRPKAETCTLCHAATLHSGAAEHLAATAASVAARLGAAGQRPPALPLTEDGGIYCGTCHLFHDPAISGEQPLAAPWVPPDTGLAGSVRHAREAEWSEIARKYEQTAPGAQFATHETRALRLPIEDGSLCRHCHEALP